MRHLINKDNVYLLVKTDNKQSFKFLELSDSLVCVNHAYIKLIFMDSPSRHDIHYVSYVNICRIALWKNIDMFSTGTLTVVTYHCLLCCGKDTTDDPELHVTQSSVNYRYALHGLLLVQTSVTASCYSCSCQQLGFRSLPPYPIKVIKKCKNGCNILIIDNKIHTEIFKQLSAPNLCNFTAKKMKRLNLLSVSLIIFSGFHIPVNRNEDS